MDEINKKEIGQRIRKIRASLGETAEVFGERFDPVANRGLVSGWENGRYTPNPERLKIIADLGNKSVDELIHGSIEGRVREYIVSHFDSRSTIMSEHEINKLVDDVFESFRMFYSTEREPDFDDLKNIMDNVTLQEMPDPIDYTDEQLDDMKLSFQDLLYVNKIHLISLIEQLEENSVSIENKDEFIKQLKLSLDLIVKASKEQGFNY